MDKVEKCSCPPGYMGLSCESCADGYYKQKTGEDTFICIECACDFCDPERGCMVGYLFTSGLDLIINNDYFLFFRTVLRENIGITPNRRVLRYA